MRLRRLGRRWGPGNFPTISTTQRRSRLVNLMIVLETLRIAGLDSHRPLHVPASQFLFGRELGIDLSADAVGGLPPEVSSAA